MTAGSGSRSWRSIPWRFGGAGGAYGGRPFPDVADHVDQAEPVGGGNAHRRGADPAQGAVVAVREAGQVFGYQLFGPGGRRPRPTWWCRRRRAANYSHSTRRQPPPRPSGVRASGAGDLDDGMVVERSSMPTRPERVTPAGAWAQSTTAASRSGRPGRRWARRSARRAPGSPGRRPYSAWGPSAVRRPSRSRCRRRTRRTARW